jgi:hypothetical protein
MIPLMCRSSSRARAGLVPWQMRLYPSPLRPGPIPVPSHCFCCGKSCDHLLLSRMALEFNGSAGSQAGRLAAVEASVV